MMSVVDLEDDADEEGSMRVYANELEVRLGRTTGGIKRLVQVRSSKDIHQKTSSVLYTLVRSRPSEPAEPALYPLEHVI
jgi:hypothetical protein